MPFQKNGKRDYKREAEWERKKKPARHKQRLERNQARYEAVRDGEAKRNDGTSVDHIKPLSKGGTNAKSNRRVVRASENYSFARNKDGSLKSQTSARERKRRRK